MAQENKIEIFENTLLKLLLRRGSDIDRKQVILTEGELGYTTDTKRVYVGDGDTPGGNVVGNKFLGAVNTVELNSIITAVTGDTVFDQERQILYTYIGGSEGWLQIADQTEGGTGVDPDTLNIDEWDSVYSQVASLSDTWSTGSVYIQGSAPSSPSAGEFWFDSATEILYVYFNGSWIEVNGDNSDIIQGSQPSSPSIGDFWYNTADSILYIYTSTGWQSTAGDPIDGSTNLVTQSVSAAGSLTSDSIDTLSINTDSLTANSITIDSYPAVTTATQSTAFKNKLRNGNFDIWQRTKEFDSSTARYYPGTKRPWTPSTENGKYYRRAIAADGYFGGVMGAQAGSFKIKRMPATQTEFNYFNTSYYMRQETNGIVWENNLNQETDDQAESTLIIQNVESAASVLGKTLTLSFWARASQNTKIVADNQFHASPWRESGLGFWTPGFGKTFDITTNWQKFTYTWTMPTYQQVIDAAYNPNNADLLNALEFDNPVTSIESFVTEHGLSQFPEVGGWHWQLDLKNAWSRASWKKHANQLAVDPAGFEGIKQSESDMEAMNDSFITTGWYDIAQIQIEEGEHATPYEFVPKEEELKRCQRYFCMSFNQSVTPGDGGNHSRGAIEAHTAEAIRPTFHNIDVSFPVTMAQNPYVTTFSPVTCVPDTVFFDTEGVVNNDEVYNTTTIKCMSGVSIEAGDRGFSWFSVGQWAGTPLDLQDDVYRFVKLQYTAEASSSW